VLVPRVVLPMVVASDLAQWMMIVIYYVTAVMRVLARGAFPVGSLAGGDRRGLIWG